MNGIIIKIEAMKRIIQALTLPMAEHQRENNYGIECSPF